MHEICIPVPKLKEEQGADVEVMVGGKKKRFSFRVAAFPWKTETVSTGDQTYVEKTSNSIMDLKNNIESYDPAWELVQIYSPNPKAKFIQVLFRHKNLN